MVDAEPEDENPFEQTVIYRAKLSPRAQTSAMRLRELKHQGHKRYAWRLHGETCTVCQSHADKGPYPITGGLGQAAPVPGRETDCDCKVTLDPI